MEDRISELQNKNCEVTQSEEKMKTNKQTKKAEKKEAVDKGYRPMDHEQENHWSSRRRRTEGGRKFTQGNNS